MPGRAGSFKDYAERERHIVDYVVSTVRDSSQATSPDRQAWKVRENLFIGKQDWGAENDYEEWQSRVFLQEYAPIIRQVAVSLQTQLFQGQGEWVNLIPNDFADREIARIREKLNRYYIELIQFPHKFYEYSIAGCIYGFATWKLGPRYCTYWKPAVVIEEAERSIEEQVSKIKDIEKQSLVLPNSMDQVEKGLQDAIDRLLGRSRGNRYLPPTVKSKKFLEVELDLQLVNPLNFYWMPEISDINNSPWYAERMFYKFLELDEFFSSNYLDPKKKQDMLTGGISGIDTDSVSSYESQAMRQRDLWPTNSNYFPRCELLEYYGPLPDKNGELLEENCHFIVGNGKHLLRDDINRSWKRQAPYFSSVFSRRPFKPNGAGIADNADSLQILINELTSLFVDDMKLDVYSPKVVNTDMLQDITQLEGGIRPGMLIHAYGGDARQVVSPMPQSTAMAPQLFQTLEMLKLSMQKGASVNTITSNPASRARISAAEIQSNDQMKAESISNLAIEIDNNCLKMLVRRIDDFVLQHGFTNDNLELLASRGILQSSEYQLLSNMTQIERFQEVSGQFQLDVRGFGAAIERNKQLSRLNEMLSQLNMMDPQAKMKLDWPRVITDVVEAYGFDGNAWLKQNTPQDKALEENSFLKINQFVAVWEQDEDKAHLPVHYQAMIEVGPAPALITHVKNHIDRLIQAGTPPPPPPPDIAQMLGLPPPPTGSIGKQHTALRSLEQDMGHKARPPQEQIQ